MEIQGLFSTRKETSRRYNHDTIIQKSRKWSNITLETLIIELNVQNFKACAKSAGDGSYLVIFDFDGDSVHNPQEGRRRSNEKDHAPEGSISTTEDLETVSSNRSTTPLKRVQKLSMSQGMFDNIMQNKLGFLESEYERLVVNPHFGETETLKRGYGFFQFLSHFRQADLFITNYIFRIYSKYTFIYLLLYYRSNLRCLVYKIYYSGKAWGKKIYIWHYQ